MIYRIKCWDISAETSARSIGPDDDYLQEKTRSVKCVPIGTPVCFTSAETSAGSRVGQRLGCALFLVRILNRNLVGRRFASLIDPALRSNQLGSLSSYWKCGQCFFLSEISYWPRCTLFS